MRTLDLTPYLKEIGSVRDILLANRQALAQTGGRLPGLLDAGVLAAIKHIGIQALYQEDD